MSYQFERATRGPERRAAFDRRIGERRRRILAPSRERRAGRERRHPVPRRESADQHLRNALQMLQNVRKEDDASPVALEGIDGAIRRLWIVLGEVERLAAERARFGESLRYGNERRP